MSIREFYIRHQDKIELTRAYVGMIIIFILAIYFNWITTNLDGLFNSQVEIIIESCINGFNVGLCP